MKKYQLSLLLSVLMCSFSYAQNNNTTIQDSTSFAKDIPDAVSKLSRPGLNVVHVGETPNATPWTCTMYSLQTPTSKTYDGVAVYFSAKNETKVVKPSQRYSGSYGDFYTCVKNN